MGQFFAHTLNPPPRRPLKIFAFDPMLGRRTGGRVEIDVPNERLKPGPCGLRLAVIDYDFTHDRYYATVDLDDPAVLMQGGLDPDESDPRFHQQMVYGVATKVLEHFEAALGRSLRLRKGGKPLRIFPHAFYGANAFYDREMHALLFGYFKADATDSGPNLPGQIVFTCLSHDIIAHEMAHVLVDQLRRYFLEPTNRDVLAFHEGFADVVAIFQHFTFQNFLRDQIQRQRADLRSPSLLVDLARQFGYATGAGRALRTAIDESDTARYRAVDEPHERGTILVAAVFAAFFAVYQARIEDLIRIATRGEGRLPDADLHPDLVNRVAREAAQTAEAILRMCIRAFDYLAPVDITFGDYLRALVTADYELNPVDDYGVRAAMIEAFRSRGVYPDGVVSLDEESLLWPAGHNLPPVKVEALTEQMHADAEVFGRSAGAREKSQAREPTASEETGDDRRDFARGLHAYAESNAALLGLDPNYTIAVQGFHSTFRVARNGRLLVEQVVQFTQQKNGDPALGGLPFRGGTTVVFSTDGSVRYVIAKPISAAAAPGVPEGSAMARYKRQADFARECSLADPRFAWHSASISLDKHMSDRSSLATLHRGISR